MTDEYHHGDLRQAVLHAAVLTINDGGPSALSLRGLAKAVGVSHTAPLHHFGSLEGVLTSLAAQGFELLASALRAAREASETFLEMGVAYVQFACEHPAHFSIMFRPDLLDDTDPAFVAAHELAFAELTGAVQQLSDRQAAEDAAAAVIAAWAMVHGIATLALTGNLDAAKVRPLVAGGDILGITRRAAGMLYGSHLTEQTTTD
jgi:AcrR family transcriptional regulator